MRTSYQFMRSFRYSAHPQRVQEIVMQCQADNIFRSNASLTVCQNVRKKERQRRNGKHSICIIVIPFNEPAILLVPFSAPHEMQSIVDVWLSFSPHFLWATGHVVVLRNYYGSRRKFGHNGRPAIAQSSLSEIMVQHLGNRNIACNSVRNSFMRQPNKKHWETGRKWLEEGKKEGSVASKRTSVREALLFSCHFQTIHA